MKTDFKINYIALTAAHFTTFPQPEQSQKILQENVRDLIGRAQYVQDLIGRQAAEKALQGMKGGNVNKYA